MQVTNTPSSTATLPCSASSRSTSSLSEPNRGEQCLALGGAAIGHQMRGWRMKCGFFTLQQSNESRQLAELVLRVLLNSDFRSLRGGDDVIVRRCERALGGGDERVGTIHRQHGIAPACRWKTATTTTMMTTSFSGVTRGVQCQVFSIGSPSVPTEACPLSYSI